MKIDFDPTPKNLIAVTWSRQEDIQTGTMGLATPNANWPEENRTFVTRGNIVSSSLHRDLSPTMVNEVVLGYNWRNEHETIPADQLSKLHRRTVGYRPATFPVANPLNLCPTSLGAAFRIRPISLSPVFRRAALIRPMSLLTISPRHFRNIP